MRLKQVCETRVVTTTAETPLADAMAIMLRMHVGALVVVEERAGAFWPVGIVTDRDAASMLTRKGDDALVVGNAMSRRLIVADEEDDFFAALTKMRRFGIRRLPVVAPDGRLRGIITLDDVIEILSARLREASSVVPRERRVEARSIAVR